MGYTILHSFLEKKESRGYGHNTLQNSFKYIDKLSLINKRIISAQFAGKITKLTIVAGEKLIL